MLAFILVSLMVISVACEENCTSEFSCASCTEVRICHNTTSGFQELFRFTCPTTAPYCNESGTCSVFPDLGCGPTDTYPCMRDGIFPDPTNCQRYHICLNNTSYSYTCPSSYYFDSNKGGCVSRATCYIFNCNGKSGVKIPYGHDGGIYAYCRDGYAAFVDRCPGAYKLDLNTQTCGPSCVAVGYKIPDIDDCTKYFYCSMEPYASDYTISSLQCPSDYGFDPRHLRCVPLKMLPNCSPAPQTTNEKLE